MWTAIIFVVRDYFYLWSEHLMTYRRVIIGTFFFFFGNISQQMKQKTNKQTNKQKQQQTNKNNNKNASDKSCLKQQKFTQFLFKSVSPANLRGLVPLTPCQPHSVTRRYLLSTE